MLKGTHFWSLSSATSAVHIMPPYFFQICFIICPESLLSGLFLSDFPITHLYDFVTSHVCCVSHISSSFI